MNKLYLAAIIWEENGVYVSKSPETGISSCGDTPEEAFSNLKEAVELYLENAKELGMIEDLNAALTSSHKFTSMIEVIT
ncbi:MAG: type II toxin-antitoxin system HicB family antitoxin [Methanotrichaceae archaeon]